MNSSQQAQKGFKTFILTLSVSLIVFSVIYYVMNAVPTDNESEVAARFEKQETVLGAEDEAESNSVFADLAEQEMDVPSRTVLAGMDTMESTESTTAVPDTGSFGVTVGLVSSLVVFIVGLFVIYKDPRKLALLGFEKRMTRDL